MPGKARIADLDAFLDRLSSAFPADPLPTFVAYGAGDDVSVRRIEELLAGRSWMDVDFDQFMRCGPDELRSYLVPDAFAYYLPGILAVTASQPIESRLHEVASLMVLPADDSYVDVWAEYGDGLFDLDADGGLPESTRRLLAKIGQARSVYDDAQRACVADYIEMFQAGVLVPKWASFWRPASSPQPEQSVPGPTTR